MVVNNNRPTLINQNSVDSDHDISMAPETHESHLLILEDDQGRKEFSLENPVYSIGRDRDCNIRLFSQFVSRHHATLVRLPRGKNNQTDYYRIVDGDAKGRPSANGLMINGRKMPAHDLKNEDEIVFGPQVRAIYYLLRNTQRSGQTDSSEYDITLINPGMTDDPEDVQK
ncbi:FHA domain-containing protein [Nostoc sp. FACHB-87]|uniref:FHA domain-containing protein n=1 Tax=Nostocales TaxID=1161 RepID=UPI001684101D|nr:MULTISPECIES: FHA domain-containing protein [Nostocales]MBD2300915.1 FHA domain-containing protein [Nostoc sp. FACHB-190]MBD2455166.1 FHA domain-containing protein [Nostoc sp. FACHB-87]MBD2474244.1 FHA domain-containing protein [Anabaena sp. FACHB-83]MBD2487239.1 FHA domain-containing protein [Aulosira sp. FACHB-615]